MSVAARKEVQDIAETKRTEYAERMGCFLTVAAFDLVKVDHLWMIYNFAPVAAFFAKASGCFVEAVVNAAGDLNGERLLSME